MAVTANQRCFFGTERIGTERIFGFGTRSIWDGDENRKFRSGTKWNGDGKPLEREREAVERVPWNTFRPILFRRVPKFSKKRPKILIKNKKIENFNRK